jgi:hypothetical protein
MTSEAKNSMLAVASLFKVLIAGSILLKLDWISVQFSEKEGNSDNVIPRGSAAHATGVYHW